MTQEEKIKEAKRLYESANADQRYILESLFPELKESEDEKIRRWIINYLDNKAINSGIIQEKTNIKNAIAWLEKKGEQKPTISYEALREGIGHFGITQYQIDYWLKKYVEVEKQSKQNPADKVEPKFHEGDMIIHKELGGDYIHNPHKIIQVDILDKKYRLEGGLVAHFNEQDDYELVKQKTAWSEEDERNIERCITKIEIDKQNWEQNNQGKTMVDADNELINWLKSLKDRYTWKPSKKQMEALLWCIAHLGGADHRVLGELYEHLEKL